LIAGRAAADPLPQPQISFTAGSGGTWNADWMGVEDRVYFFQWSLDLETWYYAPFMEFGSGLKSRGCTSTSERFFVRLKYIDDPSVDTLAKARNADFDGDGIPNAIEVEYSASDPFDIGSVGPDTDDDGMPDGWEFAFGLNPTGSADGGGDLDGDGLSNIQEYQARTKPNYYDTDGDQFSDGFELGRPGYDPLVANTNGDQDFDGINDLDELAFGTSATSVDSDSDGFTDAYELANGSNPTAASRVPFSPAEFFGLPVSSTDAQPMGNLGIVHNHGDAYKVTFNIRDLLLEGSPGNFLTNQEAWRLVIGESMSLTPPPARTYLPGGGSYPPFFLTKEFQLDGSKTYQVGVQWLGLAGLDQDGNGGAPDFRHFWSISSNDFLVVTNTPSEPVRVNTSGSKSATGVFPSGYDWTTRVNYLVPIARLGYSSSYSGGDATGPSFRKISHFGRPVPDTKPEGEAESDEAAEESYVDAFDLSLHHDTSFASIPLAASDLRLEANASVRETTWSNRSGLRPHEEITSPFGIAWSSNLCAYIETVETLGSSTTRPTTVNVVDESGRGQRFGTSDSMATFFPWPSSLTDKKTYLNELAKVGADLVLKKKFGNTLTYRPCDAWFMYSSDRLDSSPSVVRHRYWRLEEVEDRFGVKVRYEYGSNPYSLIPLEIQAVGRPDQKLTIERSTNGRRVLWIKDAKNNKTQFHYADRTVTIPSTTFSYPYQELERVEFPGGAEETYTYEVLPDPVLETIGTKVTRHLHANLKSIQRDGYAQRVFTYDFDRTKKWYDHSLGRIAISASLNSIPGDIADRARSYVTTINKVPQFGANTRVQYGVPRHVTGVSWQAMGIASSFAKTATTLTTYGPSFSAVSGTDVTDAEGKKYTYTFGGTHGEIIDTDSSQAGGTTSVSTQWLVYHSQTTLQYKDPGGAVLGSETFEFDPDSGLSLRRTVDFCGNETSWEFEEDRPVSQRIALADKPDFLTKWADPSKKTDALGRIENYEYGNHRMLERFTDIHGSVTEFVVDAQGRRREMTVEDAVGALLRKEIYDYENPTFTGFMTRKTTKAFANLSGKVWEQDLVVEYDPDPYGRLWKERVDPNGEDLVTIHTYDLNNQRETTLDPKNIETTFVHDGRNRLESVTYASNSATPTSKTFGYDDNNAKIRETDENGHSTLIERDGLGRVVKSARDLNGNDLIDLASDIVTEFGYDDLGQVRKKIDPRGFATVTVRDHLHRPQHVFGGVPAASADGTLATLTALAATSREITHGEFSYDTTKNAGGGLLAPFKPTGTIRYQAVSMTHGQADSTLSDSAIYDDVYRPLEAISEYMPGSSRTTEFDHGTVNGLGGESLVSTMTDSLGKVTRTTRDGMGRETEIIEGFGNLDPDLVLSSSKYYTSTGLVWKTVDPLLRATETEYDSVGRPVKVFQPDPVTGQITANSPVTETEYDDNGNVSALIDPLNRRTDFDHDLRNRKWRTRQPAVTDATNPDAPVANIHPTTTVAYDDAGNVIAVTDPRGATTRTFHDPANRPVKVRTNPQTGNPSDDPDAPGTHDITVSTIYDKGGLVRIVTDGNGNLTRNTYDNLGRLIGTATHPGSGNPAALPESGFDPGSYRSANPAAILVSYVHDDSGNIIEVTDGEQHRTAFNFDGFSRKTGTVWDPGKTLERTETAEYDALLQIARVDGKGHRTEYEYDGLHRLSDVIYRPDSVGTTDPDNRHLDYDKAGKVLAVTYPNDPGSIREVGSVFDKLDRLVSETSAGVTHTHPEYDKAGNRRQTTYGRTGTTLVCTYDALNRLETCEERSDALTPSGRTTTYAYDRGGLVTRKTLPNGNATTTSRDRLGRTLFLAERTSASAVVSSFDYSQALGPWPSSHDGVGNVLRCAENHSMAGVDDRVVVNTYDHANRLDTETITPSGASAVTTDYDYDLADNRVTKAIGAAVTKYSFGDGDNGANANQLREYGPSDLPTTHSFTYDANGNRETRVTSAGTDNYTWDDDNRLTGVDAPVGDYGYAYDHRGRRVVRDESAASGDLTELSFSGGSSVQEADSTGTVEVELIRGSDWGGGVGGVLYTIRDDGTNPVQRSYNAYNSRGDVVSTSGDSGTATWQAAYEAFGTRTDQDGSNPGRQRANTKDEDPTGLLNEGHRYRDLEAGVFISRDPAGFVDGPNVYAYVAQNPWSAFDPDGLFLKWLENAGARQTETKALGIDAGLAYTLFGPQPKAVRDVVEFDQRFKLAERTGGAAKVVGGTLEAGIGVVAAPVSGGVSLAGFAHGLDVATSGWSDVWSGQSSRTLTHQVIGGYSMMAGADFETADKIGGFSDAAASMGTTGVNSLALSRSPGILTARSTYQASAAEGAASTEALATQAPPMYGPFHRRFSPSHTGEVAEMMQTSGELWGQGARQAGGGRGIPAAKAFEGPLPEGALGTEFMTLVKPTPGSPLGQAKWGRGTPGVEAIDIDWVKIPIEVTKDTIIK
jgi:RHS repeat-associated protein